MTTFDEMMERIERRREQERASDKAIAALSGMTIEEFDADTTALDPRENEDRRLGIQYKENTR